MGFINLAERVMTPGPDTSMSINGITVVFPSGGEFSLETDSVEVHPEPFAHQGGGLFLFMVAGKRMLIEGAVLTFSLGTPIVLKDHCAFVHGRQFFSKSDSRKSPFHLWYYRLQRAYAGKACEREDFMEEFRHTVLPKHFDRARREEIVSMVEHGQFYPALKAINAECNAWMASKSEA